MNFLITAISSFDILANLLDFKTEKNVGFFNSLGNSDSTYICKF